MKAVSLLLCCLACLALAGARRRRYAKNLELQEVSVEALGDIDAEDAFDGGADAGAAAVGRDTWVDPSVDPETAAEAERIFMDALKTPINEASCEVYRSANQLVPNVGKYLHQLAACYAVSSERSVTSGLLMSMKMFDQASAAYRTELTRVAPDDSAGKASLYMNLGLTLMGAKRYSDVVDTMPLYFEAMEFKGIEPSRILTFADAQRHSGDYRGALSSLLQVVDPLEVHCGKTDQPPEHSSCADKPTGDAYVLCHFLLSEVYTKLEDYDNAMKHMRHYVELGIDESVVQARSVPLVDFVPPELLEIEPSAEQAFVTMDWVDPAVDTPTDVWVRSQAPLVAEMPQFVTADEANQLVALYDERLEAFTSSGYDPMVCVATAREDLRPLWDELLSSKNGFIGSSATTPNGVQTAASLCAELDTTGQDELRAIADQHHQDGFSFASEVTIFPGDNEIIDNIENRIFDVFGLPPEHTAGASIVHYSDGQSYNQRTECVGGGYLATAKWVTVQIFLNGGEEDFSLLGGGEVSFPNLGVRVQPDTGKLLIFNSLTDEGMCNVHAQHGATTVQGSKYVLEMQYHNLPVDRMRGDDASRYAEVGQAMWDCNFRGACREYLPYMDEGDMKAERLYWPDMSGDEY